MIILSHFQTALLREAQRAGASAVTVSPDLGITQARALIEPGGVRFDSGEFVEWAALERISRDENGCYALDEQGGRKLVTFSQATNRSCSLFPTARAPALLLAGVTMHRIKGIDPIEDTERKVRTIQPITGRVLDTATGLGYTAIVAARTASRVTTVELDPEVLELARMNPWSSELFQNSKIEQRIGDCSELIAGMADHSFDRIIHDPPMISLAGDLYSTHFYEQLFRVLRPGGRLFHYIGDPESPGGARTTQGVLRRLPVVGFKRVASQPEAFGVVAWK
jgi:predicted methyltransferase